MRQLLSILHLIVTLVVSYFEWRNQLLWITAILWANAIVDVIQVFSGNILDAGLVAAPSLLLAMGMSIGLQVGERYMRPFEPPRNVQNA
jgi:predicted RND superfamily exporter protein